MPAAILDSRRSAFSSSNVAGAPRKRRGRPPGPSRRLPDPEQASARQALTDCLQRNLLMPGELVARFGVHKTTISRFRRGAVFPREKLGAVKRFLEDMLSGRVVVERTETLRRREHIAKQHLARAHRADALLESLPGPLRTALDAVGARPGLEATIRETQRGIVALTVHRGDARRTAARLHASRGRIAREWAQIEHALGVPPGGDPRDPVERQRRHKLASLFLERLDAPVRDFGRAILDGALLGSSESPLDLARRLLHARAGRHASFSRPPDSVRSNEPPRSPAAALARGEGTSAPPSGPVFRASIQRLVQRFADDVLAVLRERTIEELILAIDETPAGRRS